LLAFSPFCFKALILKRKNNQIIFWCNLTSWTPQKK
jgi:hypothetical protein